MTSAGLTVSTVSVTPWGAEQDQGELSPELATLTDGVYAIKADGTLVAAANASEASYAGVGFIVNGKKYQMAKVDAVGYNDIENGVQYVSWDELGYHDMVSLKNYTTTDDTKAYAVFPISEGVYHEDADDDNYKVYDNWTVWPNYGEAAALSDFNGEENTRKIIDEQTVDDVLPERCIGRAVKDFREDNDKNEGKIDWFVPACGELTAIYLMKDDLNHVLSLVDGGAQLLSDDMLNYWSSTEHAEMTAWGVRFYMGAVVPMGKYGWYYGRLRLIRKL